MKKTKYKDTEIGKIFEKWNIRKNVEGVEHEL